VKKPRSENGDGMPLRNRYAKSKVARFWKNLAGQEMGLPKMGNSSSQNGKHLPKMGSVQDGWGHEG
jgi:hypothetical protein